MTQDDALRAIIEEAIAARSALCENELVIRLDTILALARQSLGGTAQPEPADELHRLRVENAKLHDRLSEVRLRTQEVIADLS
ncbi:hypothetical protein [Azospirillum doebereinerae]|uniref:Uncharacterized protein n=1 Tax=Azospirillum doebereinerae TaxID=92933 RepID=A0A3S0VH19_9PROT|nr:hypothetical protein [Azospirillum doebereinerae]MCG5240578.1 hypothetical protein [Azospirillum doebereinerae]RUQ68464.1 hypothetical protein EJ913_17700 [Azospirillum doebereinerae]